MPQAGRKKARGGARAAPAAPPTAKRKKKETVLRRPPNAWVLWLNAEGRPEFVKKFPTFDAQTIMVICGQAWRDMSPAEKAPYEKAARKMMEKYQEQMAAAASANAKVTWVPDVGNACLVLSDTAKGFVPAFIDSATKNGTLKLIYEVKGEPREKSVPASEVAEMVKPWEPVQYGACQIRSQTSGGWTDGIIEAIDGSNCDVVFQHDGEMYVKTVPTDDTDVLRWPTFSEGELLLNVTRFRKMFRPDALRGQQANARKFCAKYFKVLPGQKKPEKWTWKGGLESPFRKGKT